MKEIIQALGFDPLPTAIIILQLGVISVLFRKFYKDTMTKFDNVIKTRKAEIEIVKESIKQLSSDIEEVKDKVMLNNKTTTLLAYHQCMNEAMRWEEKGSIPVGAKMHFNRVWNKYIELGDGHGEDPKVMVDRLKVIN